MQNNIIWKPYGEYKTKSNIRRFMRKHKIKTYDELVKKSARNIKWFWKAALEDLDVEWYEPYKKVLDDSAGFPWAKWFVGGKINIVHNCLDRHAQSWRRNKLALIWEGDDGATRTVSYLQLYQEVNRLANAIKSLGIKKGDTVGIYMPMVPEIVTVLMACLKIGAVAIPVFSGFGATALATRLNDAEAKLLFTADGSARRAKLVQIKQEADKALEMTPSVKKAIVLKRMGIDVAMRDGRDLWWHDVVPQQSPVCETERLDAEDYSLIIYTSGTTGKPKGTVHTHAGCMAQMAKELGYYFDVKEEDTFFWVTDIGWMMGPWEIIGVQNFGGTYLIFEGAPDYPKPDRLWDVCERHGVTILGISPTAIRLLMRSSVDWVKKHDLSKIRILGSTGEPWDPESYQWFFEHVGGGRCPIINISGGTEIVGCLLSPLPITELKPCTLRGPGLGMDIDVFDEDGKPIRGGIGHLVCKKPAPSMTKGFLKDPDRYIATYFSRWPNVWYHGDWAHVDDDGFWFLHGRADDTIKIAGRRTGPAEIEAALIDHPAVSEAAAIGVPHEIKGENVVCFVVLHPGYEPSEPLREELKNQVVKIMGKTLRPEDLRFVGALPKTRSAKILRGVIKKKWLGQDIGDIASVENPDAIEEIAHAK
ncbi:MAG: acetate--CoA ligase [Candidatus Abyssobacteria bacterium SURF_5]|uniref:acetate--CoA ligase n=1 Tax=Abyssobacteria bacterium (strain SURF_5) TaxID=2093360 RepID=A0A3A4NR03_ABYX5|nr:MAG: acetate--CoA ligase [Candidatus Abyssubacteria bacterium SURF_5]